MTGKVVWITGGTRGLGFAVARGFADRGASVALSGRDPDRAAEAAAELERAGQTAFPLPLDVAVLGAGISPIYTSAEKVSVDDWRRIVDVNLSGTFFTLRAAARPMLEARKGSLVVISSILGRRATPKLAAYCATKAGIDQLIRVLAVEWADRGLRVNAVAPGWVETDMTARLRENEDLTARLLARTALKRMARPDEIVGAVLYLASDDASYTTGTSIAIDGGWSAG